MNSSTRITRDDVLDLCETIHATSPDLPVLGARVLGLHLTLILAEAQPAPGAARRGPRHLAIKAIEVLLKPIVSPSEIKQPSAK